MSKWAVSYEGWLVVEADSEKEADSIAMSVLGSCRIPNDGVEGEWLLVEMEGE